VQCERRPFYPDASGEGFLSDSLLEHREAAADQNITSPQAPNPLLIGTSGR
jgi:hypothetical protein